MKYSLALVDNGKIVGRSNVELQAHGEETRVLKDAEPGVGRRGESVRVPHPLEDPSQATENPANGVALALVGDLPDGDGGTKTVILRDLSVSEDRQSIEALRDDVAALTGRLRAVETELAERVKAQAGSDAIGGGKSGGNS